MRALLLAFIALPLPAAAASLRPFVALDAPVVRLSDLFAGVEADRVLGAAPAPGQRIVVEAPQLAAIARQFGVDWRPGSPSDRMTLERAFRALSSAETEALLRPALLAAGAPPSGSIELPAFVPPLVPPQGGDTRVAALDYDGASGRFTATLSTQSGDTAPTLTRVSGRVEEMTEIAVPARRLLAGEPIGAGDVRLTPVRASSLASEVVRDPARAVGLASRRVLQAGQPIAVGDLQRAVVVPKGVVVLMALDSPGISLTAQGIADEPGGVGERIRILIPASKAVVLAEVTGPGRVRVVPGSAPVRPAVIASR